MSNSVFEMYLMKVRFKGCTKCTETTYRAQLDKFNKYMKEVHGIDVDTIEGVQSVTGLMLESWQMHVRETGVKPATEQVCVASVRAFFAWAVKAMIIERDPSVVLISLKIKHEEQPHLPWADVEKIMESYHSRNEIRDLCIMSVGFTMGLRSISMRELNIGDVFEDHITYRNKGGAIKTAYVPKPVMELVTEYITKYRKGAAAEDPLFISERGGRIQKAAVANIFHKAGELIGVHLTPHASRRACLSRVSELGGIELAQSIAQHSSSKVTERYIYDSPEHMNKLYENMPLFGGKK